MLDDAKIQYLRIDGNISMKERTRIINQFQGDPNIDALLMTTGTGAEG